MRKLVRGFLFMFVLSVGWWLPQAVAAAPVPPVPTLPLSADLVTVAGNGNLFEQSPRVQYIQITPAKVSQKGAVWLKKPISFKQDFFIEMYVFIQAGGSGDGMAVVLKDSANKQLMGTHTAGSLGVYGEGTYTSTGIAYAPLSRAMEGAILNSIAIEFDNYLNIEDLDWEVRGSGPHIATIVPGVEQTYIRNSTNFPPSSSWTINGRVHTYRNIMHHHGVQSVPLLANGSWVPFRIWYSKSANTLYYRYGQLDYKQINNFTGGDPTKQEPFKSGEFLLGFVGATGADRFAVQEMAVTFTQVPGILDLSLHQEIFADEATTPFFDSRNLKDSEDGLVKLDLTHDALQLKYRTFLDVSKEASISSMGHATFTVDLTPGVAYDLASFKLKQGEVTNSATAVADPDNNKVRVTTNGEVKPGQQVVLEFIGRPQLDLVRTTHPVVTPQVRVTGSNYGDISLPLNKYHAPLRFEMSADLELETQALVYQVGDHDRQLLYDSINKREDPVVISDPDVLLGIKNRFWIGADSTMASFKATLLYLINNPTLEVDLDSFTINGNPLTSSHIATDDDGFLDLEGTFSVGKGQPLEIEYLARPKGFVADQDSQLFLDLSASLETVSGIGEASMEEGTTLQLVSRPQIAVAETVPWNQLATATPQIWSGKQPQAFSGEDTDINSSRLTYFLKDLGTVLPTQEYQPESGLPPVWVHEGRRTFESGQQAFQFTTAQLQEQLDSSHYYGLFAQDGEGHFSNVVYLKALVVSDRLTLERVPALRFENPQGLRLNDLLREPGVLPLADFSPKSLLGTFDGTLNGEGQVLVRDTRLDKSRGWQLSVAVTAVRGQRALGPAFGGVLQLALKEGPTVYLTNHQEALTITHQGEKVTGIKEAVLAEGSGSQEQGVSQRLLQVDPAATKLLLAQGSQAGFFDKDGGIGGPYGLVIQYTLTIK